MSDNDIKILLSLGVTAVFGYLLGSIPFGLVLTRAAGLGDIRSLGSGNIGATNVLRTGRRDLAALTLALDAGKAGIAYFLAYWIEPALMGENNPSGRAALGMICGAFAFIGHCYPIWLKFKGGKGVATFLGLLLAAFFPIGVIFSLTWLVVAAVFRMSSLAALLATLVTPLVVITHFNPALNNIYIFKNGPSDALMVVTVYLWFFVALIFWKHRANIGRIFSGREPKIGAKKPDAAPPSPAPERGETRMVEPISPDDIRPTGGSG